MWELPKDPMLLLSVVNTKLRDFYPTLDAFCDETSTDKDALVDKLKGIDYEYDSSANQFV